MALVINEGRKWTHVIFMEYPVQVEKVLNNEAQRFDYVPKLDRKLFMHMKSIAKIWYGRKSNAPKNIQSALWGNL